MRIVFLSQLLPLPLDAGPKIRAYYVLRHLAEAGHDVALVCFVRPADRQSDVRELATFCRSVDTVPLTRSRVRDVRDICRSLASKTPFLILRDRVPEMEQHLGAIVRTGSFDAVHADQLWMAPYAAHCPDVGLRVLDQHNAVFKVPQRMAANHRNPFARKLLLREAGKLSSFERSMLDRFDRVVWVSDDDRRALVDGNGRPRRDVVIPIAVDALARRPIERPSPFRVTFLAGMHWPPNAEGARWFADRVWPAVAEAAPDAVFTVIGKGNAGRLGPPRFSARTDVTGYVPDLDRHLSETAAFIVPLLTGAGMRVKILDAWSWALPVVSTSIGAEGIDATAHENILVGDTPEAFAGHVISVLKDRRLAKRLSENGRATVETLYDWRRVYRAWDGVYQ